jgi:hypothetical protein
MTSDKNVQHCQFKRGHQFVKHSRLFKYVFYIQLSTGYIELEQMVCFAKHKPATRTNKCCITLSKLH